MRSEDFDDEGSVCRRIEALVQRVAGRPEVGAAEVAAVIAAVTGPRINPAALDDPAARVGATVFESYLVCLECGRRVESLTRHLGRSHGIGFAAYRDRWLLPVTYPAIASAYAARRSRAARAGR